MRADNETCVQRVRVIFHFYEEKLWKQDGDSPLDRITKVKNPKPEAIRNLQRYLSRRLERIAGMMEVLSGAHGDWAVTGKKDQVIMETETWDFNDAVQALRQYGFKDEEFRLKVEYTRKWGVL